ncbi:MAG: hypothetical protein B6U95_01615 [Thermofilum sp. ex4484_82]|nr:MAG: hypothetical protein B6U95_01615 [Thermofilum sp. ex4484_82]OYT39594.1 MAG: hypothetical protein B6U96_01620 [Archaeoglobales archaeon ex4484_92]
MYPTRKIPVYCGNCGHKLDDIKFDEMYYIRIKKYLYTRCPKCHRLLRKASIRFGGVCIKEITAKEQPATIEAKRIKKSF